METKQKLKALRGSQDLKQANSTLILMGALPQGCPGGEPTEEKQAAKIIRIKITRFKADCY